MRPEVGTFMIVPSGFLLLTCSHTHVYARWTVSGDKDDSNRVIFILGSLLQEFAEIRVEGSGYRQVKEFPQSDSICS